VPLRDLLRDVRFHVDCEGTAFSKQRGLRLGGSEGVVAGSHQADMDANQELAELASKIACPTSFFLWFPGESRGPVRLLQLDPGFRRGTVRR